MFVQADGKRLSRTIAAFRRGIAPEFVLSLMRAAGGADFTLAQLATLYLLDSSGGHTVGDVADAIGRSLSATSRLIDQLVRRGLVGRVEDQRDRRARRVHVTREGCALLSRIERGRADAQLSLMAHLSQEEQAVVDRAMGLLADAAGRRRDAGQRSVV